MAKSFLQQAIDGDLGASPSASTTRADMFAAKKSGGPIKVQTFDQFSGGNNTRANRMAYREYLKSAYYSGQVADVGSMNILKKEAAARDMPGLLEDVGGDIASATTGKRKIRERQAGRLAGMVGQVAPRTQQQTASLLSSSQAAPATLLG